MSDSSLPKFRASLILLSQPSSASLRFMRQVGKSHNLVTKITQTSQDAENPRKTQGAHACQMYVCHSCASAFPSARARKSTLAVPNARAPSLNQRRSLAPRQPLCRTASLSHIPSPPFSSPIIPHPFGSTADFSFWEPRHPLDPCVVWDEVSEKDSVRAGCRSSL